MGDWADLPLDLLGLIGKRTDLYEDFVAFGGVCRSWRSVAVKGNFSPSTQVPWLMLPGKNYGDVRRFVSVTKGGMARKVELPEARGRHCVSSKGWLITTNEEDEEIELLQPLTRVRIPLPHPRTYKYYIERGMTVRKAALSASPSITEDYVLMVIFGGFYVGFWKPGNNIWTLIETQQHSRFVDDVIYYKDEFYVVSAGIAHLLLRNMNSCTSQIVGDLLYCTLGANAQASLVDNGSELLIISTRRDIAGPCDKYNEFAMYLRVFKFDPKNSKLYYMPEVISGEELGGRSIFVSPKGDTVVVASPAAAGIEPNCIYFADWFVNPYVAINPSSDKNTRDAERRIVLEFRFSLHSNYSSPPIWILPSF